MRPALAAIRRDGHRIARRKRHLERLVEFLLFPVIGLPGVGL